MSPPPLSADHGTRWTRNAEPWVIGPSFYPLDLVERIILILELRYELRGHFNRKFCKSKFLPSVGFELLNLGLLGGRLVH